MASGTVTSFDPVKGFGFIEPEYGGEKVFLPGSVLERAGLREIADGQKVTCELESGPDGHASATSLALVT